MQSLISLQQHGALPSTAKTELLIDLIVMVVIAAIAFGWAYHPYFWGDELVLHRLAIKHDYAFWPIFREISTYKPRLVENGITALLAEWQMARWVTAALQAVCLVWISALLYGAVRYLFAGGRLLAWLAIATVVTSRYAMVFYYDYSSGLLDLLSTALMLSALLAAFLAWRGSFNRNYSACALMAAVLCVFVHERYVAGLLVAGVAIAIAECTGPSPKRRLTTVGWALSLGLVPLLLFWAANTAFTSLPLATGTAGRQVGLDWDTVGAFLMYAYNVFLGGNYGPPWYWGSYNHAHPVGEILGWGTAACTVAIAVAIVVRKGIAWRHRWLVLSLVAVAVAMIAVASLPGSVFLQARWMFPVGLLLTTAWIVLVEGLWRYAVTSLVLATNLMYLYLGSHDGMEQVSASRSVSSLVALLLSETPSGRNGILVGYETGIWAIGGGSLVDMGPRPGDTFSKVSLKSAFQIDPLVPGRAFDPNIYDFGIAFDRFDTHQVARYRLVTVRTALDNAGASTPGNLPLKGDVDLMPKGPTAIVVEYYNKSLDHYVITHLANEIAALDGGAATNGWVRTGQSFAVYTAASPFTSPVCRFYVPAAQGSAYFFGRGTGECAAIGRDNPTFIHESAQFFHVVLPTAGVCPNGTREVYRVFSNRNDVNHRYMVDRSIRDRMVASGWVAEGDGPNSVVMCVPVGGS